MSHESHSEPLRLVDRFGRIARDLRVSLTDRCTLRCSYCMPEEGLEWLPSENTLSDDEVVRLVRIGVDILGIREIRLTGGEPLLRKGLESIIERSSRLVTDEGYAPDLALTTNGLGLVHRAESLAAAGLNRVNVSLDTLDPANYAAITRRDRVGDVVRGIDAAAAAGLTPIKINTVVLRGVNDGDLPDLFDFCLDRGLELRVIEEMPIGAAGWNKRTIVTQDEILALLGRRHTLTPIAREDPHSPAGMWSVDGDPDRRVGVIASVSSPFCQRCDRTRLTSDGQIRSCLFSMSELDLRTPLREGASDEELARLWAQEMWVKPAAHGLDSSDFAVASRTMSRIGG